MFVLEAETADDWESVVSRCFVPLRCAGFEKTFTGRMEHTPLDERISISRVTTGGTSAERTERLARGSGSDDVHISLQRSSRGLVAGDGSATSVAPGAVSIYATDRPYYLDYSWPEQEQLIVQVSRESLGLPERMLEDTMNRLAVPGGVRDVAARGLFSYVADPPLAASPLESAHVARDLACVMIRSSFRDGTVAPRTSGGLRHMAQQFLREHATTPGIDMADVAQHHFVSRRRLYQAFESAGTTPAAYLRAERVRRAARVLEDPESAMSIEQIARASGFDDVTTFTRAFRRAHGQTPRDWRADARATRAAR